MSLNYTSNNKGHANFASDYGHKNGVTLPLRSLANSLRQNHGTSGSGLRRAFWSLYGPRYLIGLVALCLLTVLYLSFQLSSITSSAQNEQNSCDCSTKEPSNLRKNRLKLAAADWNLESPLSSRNGESPLVTENKNENFGHKLCVVVPFRDRFEELQIFAPHLNGFLKRQGVEHELLILNQFDKYRFNRAALINVGYYESNRRHCDYFAMHDVDLLPKNARLSYAYPPRENCVYHVASPEYHPRYNYSTFIGGILIMSLENFRRVNGMSNRYWGWGLEDDEFYLRLKEADLTILRPQNLSTNKNSTFMHIHDKRLRKRDTLRIGDQKKVSRRRDRITGVDSVAYTVLSRVDLKIQKADVLVVNVQLECDLQFSPWCEFPV